VLFLKNVWHTAAHFLHEIIIHAVHDKIQAKNATCFKKIGVGDYKSLRFGGAVLIRKRYFAGMFC